MHSFSIRSSLIFLLLAAAGRAATPTPAAVPTAPPPAHVHAEPILLDQFVTSAAPFGRSQIDLAQATTVLSGRHLLLRQQASIGETVAGETGMSATSFGPAASRPIIRGLGGDRIRLLENSIGTLDASVVSPDHAVAIEPLLVERVEVVRGPAALLYGSSAVGGVVNAITHRVETELPTQRSRAAAELRYNSVSDEWTRGGLVDVALHHRPDQALILHLDGYRRSAGDVRIPGYAASQAWRAEANAEAAAEGEPAPVHARGRLPNSANAADGGAAGLSFVNRKFHVGYSHSGINQTYGIPGASHDHGEDEDGGTRIVLRQRRDDFQGEWRGGDGLLHTLRVRAGRANYRHSEIEPDGEVGTEFRNRGHDARLELLHGGDQQPWSGAIGVQAGRSAFSAFGEEAFLPPSVSRSTAVFTFQELTRGSATWQFGGRWERSRVEVASQRVKHRENEPSASAGVVYKLDPVHSVALVVTYTGRSPNAQELFADGPHAGTQAYEIGDRALRAERSRGIEASVRRRAGLVTGSATVFANRFDGYIFDRPTGGVAVEEEGVWKLETGSDHADHHDHGHELPIFQYMQQDARFWGAEVETWWHLHHSKEGQFDVRLAADLVRGRSQGESLPRIPAARFSAGALWVTGPWSAGVDAQHWLAQRRVATNESESGSYTLVSADLSYRFATGRVSHQVFVRGTNLADDEARPHASRLKEVAPLPGRGVVLGLRMTY